MRTYTSIILLITYAIGISYFVLLGGVLFPTLFGRLYRIGDNSIIWTIMPLPSRLAINYSWNYSWIIALLVSLITIICIVILVCNPARLFQFTLLGICGQSLLLWLTLFAYFYSGFEGTMSLHHDSEFDFREFMGPGFGVFPITLIGLVGAFITALFTSEHATRKS